MEALAEVAACGGEWHKFSTKDFELGARVMKREDVARLEEAKKVGCSCNNKCLSRVSIADMLRWVKKGHGANDAEWKLMLAHNPSVQAHAESPNKGCGRARLSIEGNELCARAFCAVYNISKNLWKKVLELARWLQDQAHEGKSDTAPVVRAFLCESVPVH